MNINNDFRLRGLSEDIGSSLSPKESQGAEKGAFKDMLSNLMEEVDTLQKDANSSIEGLASGESADIHNIMIKLEEAGVAFELMMEIRNKLVDAYQQILRMQP